MAFRRKNKQSDKTQNVGLDDYNSILNFERDAQDVSFDEYTLSSQGNVATQQQQAAEEAAQSPAQRAEERTEQQANVQPRQQAQEAEFPDGLLRYAPGGSDVTYFYLPCAENSSMDYLRVMQKNGKAYININVQAQQQQTQQTYQILDVENEKNTLKLGVLRPSENANEAEKGVLEVETIDLSPQMTEALKAVVYNNEAFLEENQSFVRIPPVTENFDEQDVTFQPSKETIEKPVDEQTQNDEFAADFVATAARVSGARGQKLKTKENLSILGQQFENATQSIDFAKNLNMDAPQKISVISSTDTKGAESDLLISVTTEGSSRPLAVFREIEDRNDVVSLEIEPRLWESLQKSNPKLRLPEVEYDHLTSNGYARFEIKKLEFSQTKGLETGEVNGANEDFALSFSALGVLIKDTVRNQGASRTSGGGMPNNIAISEKCIEKMLGNSPVCSIDSTEPTYSQVLVSLNELNRSRTSVSRRSQPQKLQLGLKESSLGKSSRNLTDDDYQVVMHSVPFAFSMPKGLRRTENLNIIQSKDKNGKVETQLYMQLKNPQTNRVQRPKAYTLVGASVEKVANTNEYVLYMELKDGNKPPINVQLKRLLISPDSTQSASTQANIAALKYLKQLAPDAFAQAAQHAISRAHVHPLEVENLSDEPVFSETLFNSFSDADPAQNIDIYPAAANRAEMEINSFNVVSSMQITEVQAQEAAQAEPQTEVVEQNVVLQETVEQIPDPEQPAVQEIFEERQLEKVSEQNLVDEGVQPSAEETEQQEESAEPQEEVQEEPAEEEQTEETLAEAEQPTPEEELDDDIFAAPVRRRAQPAAQAQSQEEQEEQEQQIEEATVVETRTDNAEKPAELELMPGEALYSTLDPNAARALSPQKANMGIQTMQGVAPTQSAHPYINSKKEKHRPAKAKKLLKVKEPKRGAVNLMLGIGTLLAFVAYFVPGVGPLILTTASFALFGIAALYGGVKVQNIVKDFINSSRERRNNKKLEKQNDKDLSASYLRERMETRDARIEHIKADPYLSESEKKAQIEHVKKQYQPYEKQLPDAEKAESKQIKKEQERAEKDAAAVADKISHHSAVLKELTDAKGSIVKAEKQLAEKTVAQQQREVERDTKVDEYHTAQQAAEKAEKDKSEAAGRMAEMHTLLEKSQQKKLSKKEQTLLDSDIEYFRVKTNEIAESKRKTAEISKKEYQNKTAKQLLNDAKNVNEKLEGKRLGAIEEELSAKDSMNDAQTKLDKARDEVAKATKNVEAAEKDSKQALNKYGFDKKADLDKTIVKEQEILDNMLAPQKAPQAQAVETQTVVTPVAAQTATNVATVQTATVAPTAPTNAQGDGKAEDDGFTEFHLSDDKPKPRARAEASRQTSKSTTKENSQELSR